MFGIVQLRKASHAFIIVGHFPAISNFCFGLDGQVPGGQLYNVEVVIRASIFTARKGDLER